MITLAFDIYGTLINTNGISGRLYTLIGNQATNFSAQWRTKQLEYTWRYGLMSEYRNFRECTRQALDWTCNHLGCRITDEDRASLMTYYLELPPFADVLDGLSELSKLDVKMYAFSNGLTADLEVLLEHAELLNLLDGIVSAHDKRTFKPNPLLYRYMVERGGSETKDTYLISSNTFDISGAIAVGLRALWIQRDPKIQFDPWEFRPTEIVSNFGEIVEYFRLK